MAWPPWSRNVPQTLASYVTMEAQSWLRLDCRVDDRIGAPDGRRQVLESIYRALAGHDIAYALEQYHPSETLQSIRSPAEILDAPREGTCLDLALLFCGLCMANRLLPMVVVIDGHALAAVSLEHGLADWNGYRPERSWFDRAPVTDASKLRELVQSGAYVAVECTGFARSERLAHQADPAFPETVGRIDGLLPFERALAAGGEQLESAVRPFQFAIDVAVAQFQWRVPTMQLPTDRAAPSVVPRQAPATPAWFTGRATELEELRTLLAERPSPPTVALYGLAGVGKTSLAARIAADAAVESRYSAGTLWLDLKVLDTMAALEQVALAFGYGVSQYTNVDSRAALVRSVLRDRQVLLILDNAAREDQVTPLLPNSPEAAVLIASIDEDLARLVAGTTVEVPVLDDEEGAGLVAAILGDDHNVPRKALRRLVEQLGGLPLALELAAKLAARQLEKEWGDIDQVIEALGDARARLDLGLADRQVRGAFTACYESALDAAEQARFALLGAFGPGSIELGPAAAAWGVDEETAKAHLGGLTGLSLIQQVGPDSYRLQTLVRDFACELFAQREEGERRQVTERIASWYLHWVNAYEESQAAESVCWYRYERPEWQEKKRKLIYLLFQLPDRTAARLAFARLYLDAFWWWGSYVSFSYCDQLLADYERVFSSPEDQAWGSLLNTINRDFPRGADKRGAPTWPKVERALVDLARAGGFDDGARVAEDDAQRRHLRAIVGVFLGEARRYLDLCDSEADTRYDEALDLLEADSDWWNLAWALFDYAALAVDRGHAEEAEARAAKALSLGRDHRMTDLELRANLWRIQADVHWLRGDLHAAFRRYAEAVLLAYRLQGWPHEADYYTFVFYAEITGRVNARLKELGDAGRTDDVAVALAAIEAVWRPFWNSSDRAASIARDGAFPAAPSESKLRSRSLRYAREFGGAALAATEAVFQTLDDGDSSLPVRGQPAV